MTNLQQQAEDDSPSTPDTSKKQKLPSRSPKHHVKRRVRFEDGEGDVEMEDDSKKKTSKNK